MNSSHDPKFNHIFLEDIKIDVVMTCYNSSKYISCAIESVAKQSHKNWEIIICDDFSTDKSLKVIDECIKRLNIKNKIIIIKHNKNYGCGTSLKDCIDKGTGNLIAILDSDDTLENIYCLQKMIIQHIIYPKASMVYSNYNVCDKNLKKYDIGPNRSLNKNETYFDGKIHISHFKVIKRKYYNKTDGINDKLLLHIDKDLILKLEEVGQLIFINELLYNFRKREDSITYSFHKKQEEYKNQIYEMNLKMIEDTKKRRSLENS